VGAVVYAYTGNQYMTSPAFGSLGNEVFKKVSFSFMIPTLIFLGVLYASVSARFVFFRVFEGTRHKTSHTVIGWASWAGILALTWTGAFIIVSRLVFVVKMSPSNHYIGRGHPLLLRSLVAYVLPLRFFFWLHLLVCRSTSEQITKPILT